MAVARDYWSKLIGFCMTEPSRSGYDFWVRGISGVHQHVRSEWKKEKSEESRAGWYDVIPGAADVAVLRSNTHFQFPSHDTQKARKVPDCFGDPRR
jgi:hypothetical protein